MRLLLRSFSTSFASWVPLRSYSKSPPSRGPKPSKSVAASTAAFLLLLPDAAEIRPLVRQLQRPAAPSPLLRLAAEHPHFTEHLAAYGQTFAALERSGHLRAAPFPYGDQRTRHAHLLRAAVAEPKVRGLGPWLDMLRTKFGRGTPPHPRVLADINRTFLELQQALHLSRSVPEGHAVQVGCDYQRRGAGFDMQVHDASGQLHTQVEVTSVAQPIECRLQLHNAVSHVEKKAPRTGRRGAHWGAIGLTWARHASPTRVVEDLMQDLNIPHPRLAGASLRLDGISLFAADSAEHCDLGRIRKEGGHWQAHAA